MASIQSYTCVCVIYFILIIAEEGSEIQYFDIVHSVYLIEQRLMTGKERHFRKVEQQVKWATEHAQDFENKRDFECWKLLFSNIPNSGQGQQIFVSGVNKGQSINKLHQLLPDASFIGFEVVPESLQAAESKLQHIPHLKLYHKGVSDKVGESFVSVSSKDPTDEMAGLYEPTNRWSSTERSSYKVKLDTLEHFKQKNNLQQFLYVLIDTEGHEPNVISGMHLEKIENRRTFPVFQYELGGTWVDSRHRLDQLGQFGTAVMLELYGYELFLMGAKGLLRVYPEFFRANYLRNEGDGPYVQGNLLAVHPVYAQQAIMQSVRSAMLNTDTQG